MQTIGKYKYLSLLMLLGLVQNCSQIKPSESGKGNSKTKYYTIDDFKSVEKFDNHIHFNTDDTAFIEQSREDNFRFLVII